MNYIQGFFKKSWDYIIIRFLCVGSFNTILDFTIFNLLVAVAGFPVLLANTVSVTVGFTASYLLNHRIVFRHPQAYSLKNYARFFLVTGVGALVIQNFVIHLAATTHWAKSGGLIELGSLEISEKTLVLNIGKAIAVILGMVWNFLLYRYVVFPNETKTDLQPPA